MSAARIAKAAIKIPKRIERGPTDILKALASTVNNMPSEPNQLFMDDPFLLPRITEYCSIYSLARISGKNTAKFLLNKHPELFRRDLSEPKVREYFPPEEYREDMEFSIDDLKWCVDNSDAVNGIIAYNKLVEEDVKIDDETLMQFFELLCYTNEQKMDDLLEIQKSYFVKDFERDIVNQTWNNTGLASKIFNQIKADLDPPRVYSAMIAGLSRFNQHQAASQVFNDFRENHPDKGLYVEAYDGLLCSIKNLYSSVSTAHNAIDDIVKHMEEHLVMPNLRIFNSILIVYRNFSLDDSTTKKAIALVNDMRSLDIEPSLATYSNLIQIIIRHKRGHGYEDSIAGLLDYIYKNDKILDQIRDERDIQFLGPCMRVIVNLLNSLQLANKLHKIYLKRPSLFGTMTYKQSYLDWYFRILVTTEQMENIWQFYTENVPMTFRPTVENYDALAEALDIHQADEEIINRVGSDIIKYRLGDKVKNDAIFRRDPKYVEKLEKSLQPRDREPRGRRSHK